MDPSGKTMRALVLKAYNHLEIAEVPMPEPSDDEVLVAVHACGICGSDVHGMDGSTGRRIPPLIMGHEAAGVIVHCGKNATKYPPGTRVTFDSTVWCGRCYFCRRGKVNLCDSRQVLGVSCKEYKRNGAFAEYVVVPERILYPLPNEVSFIDAALVEPLSVALHAVSISDIQLGDYAVVIGAGVIGSLVIQLLKIAGVDPIVIEINQARIRLAKELGATKCLQPTSEELTGTLRELTEGRGADYAFEAVGNTAAFQTALASIRKGGTVVAIGNIAPEVPLQLQKMVTGELHIQGSCASAGEYDRCLNLLAEKKIDTNKIISAVAPLEEGPKWFERLRQTEHGLLKVILQPMVSQS